MNEKSEVAPAHEALARHDWSRARDLFLTVRDRPLTADDSDGPAQRIRQVRPGPRSLWTRPPMRSPGWAPRQTRPGPGDG